MMLIPRVLEVLDTAPVVSLAEQKLFAKVDYEVENALIAKMVEAATCACEKWVSLYFRQKRVEWVYTAPVYRYGDTYGAYCKPVELPYGPNQIIESVTLVDVDGTETLLSEDQYTQSGYSILSITTERRSSLSHYGQPTGYVKVVYKAGYHITDVDASLVWPLEEDMVQAVRLLATEMYENRQVSVTGTIVATLDVTHKTLLAPYRRNKLF